MIVPDLVRWNTREICLGIRRATSCGHEPSCLAKVKRITHAPITANGAVHIATDVVQAIAHEAAEHIASSLCGGIWEAKTIANIACASGLRRVLISAFEVGVSVATNIDVACSSDSIEVPCEVVGLG
jgi:L-alanine-DL-glutamate epimerase-like enolase superfamily enzyme